MFATIELVLNKFKAESHKELLDSIFWLGVFIVIGYIYSLISLHVFQTPVGLVEYTGVVLNFACVYLTARQIIWNWIFGILAVVFLGILFYQLHLYSSMVLNWVYFFPVQFWGMVEWCRTKNKPDRPVTWLSATGSILTLGIVTAFAIGWGTIMGDLTGSQMPYLDAAILSMSIMAQYLLTIKKIESWILWTLVNITSVIVYSKAGAYMVAIQYGCFLVFSFKGFYDWGISYKTGVIRGIKQ